MGIDCTEIIHVEACQMHEGQMVFSQLALCFDQQHAGRCHNDHAGL